MADAGYLDVLTRTPSVGRHRLTVAEFYRMADVGILTEQDRVELIEGQIVDMAPIGSQHIAAVNVLNRRLVMAVGARATVSVQNPVQLSNRSLPQPDFALLRPRADDYRHAPPQADEVLLVVEVSHSTLSYDRDAKLPLYAYCGIREVWIVDVAANWIDVYRTPVSDAYTVVSRVERSGTLDVEALPGVAIPAAGVLE